MKANWCQFILVPLESIHRWRYKMPWGKNRCLMSVKNYSGIQFCITACCYQQAHLEIWWVYQIDWLLNWTKTTAGSFAHFPYKWIAELIDLRHKLQIYFIFNVFHVIMTIDIDCHSKSPTVTYQFAWKYHFPAIRRFMKRRGNKCHTIT